MFRHVGIVVHNLEQQLKFYKDLLGLEIYYNKIEQGLYLEKLLGFKDASANIYKLGKNNKVIVELLHFNNKLFNIKNINERGITHFALTVENLDFIYENMIQQNVAFISEPIVTEDNKHKVCFCKDYEDNFIELVEVL